jgi:hypothetical protein
MSMKRTRASSISTRRARKPIVVMNQTLSKREESLKASDPEVVVSRRSNSRLTELYRAASFRRAWDRDIWRIVATNAIHLRNYRQVSQLGVAKAMKTSQSAVARIEGGDENVTLGTVRRLAEALKGRIRFAIEPEELSFPGWPGNWWDFVGSSLTTSGVWSFDGAESRLVGTKQHVAAKWTTGRNVKLEAGEIMSALPAAPGELT